MTTSPGAGEPVLVSPLEMVAAPPYAVSTPSEPGPEPEAVDAPLAPALVISSEELAVAEASDLLAEAVAVAPSACVRVRADAPAEVRVGATRLGRLVEVEQGTWEFVGALPEPSIRPVSLTLASDGVVLSRELIDPGAIDVSVELRALADDVAEPRRSRRRSARSSSRRTPTEESRPAQVASAPGLGPPVAPRTR